MTSFPAADPSVPPTDMPAHDILIVEDSPTQAERLKYILEKNHYPYTHARDGREALTAIVARPPTLVISDVVMPEMDGFELCRRIKSDERLRAIPLILLTTLTDPVDVVKGLECGADNFIFKPYDERYLVERIAAILANQRLRRADAASVGVEVFFAGRKFFITSDRLQILNLLLTTYETAVERNRELAGTRDALRQLNENLETKVRERTAALQVEVAERTRAEAHVRAQAELLNKARDAIIAIDLEHRIIYWNASAERVYGWPAAEVLGRQVGELELGLSRDRSSAAYKELLARGEWRGEFQIRTRSGELRAVETTWSLVLGPDNQPHSILSIDTDVTEKKKLEAEFLRAQRMENIGMLAGGVAHDLNNALAPVLLATELLQAESTDARQRRLLEMISAGARRGADMVKQILTFARGKGSQRQPLQLRHLIKEMAAMCRQTFPKSIEIRTQAGIELWPVIADATQVHQVLLNLCVNARDAMPDGGVLTLTATNTTVGENDLPPGAADVRPGPFVTLTIEDTGTGMPPDVIARIFDPFFTTKAADKGTGLGLSTVQHIVRGHGGHLTVESTPGKGTTFKILLPAESAAESPRETEPAALPMGKGELVLVADDETAIRNIAAHALEAFGYKAITAVNGAEAVALCAQHRDTLQLMITDAAMPVMNGPAAIRAVRQFAPRLKIVLASGMDTREATEGTEAIDATLGKPYSAEQLLRIVHDVIAGKAAGS